MSTFPAILVCSLALISAVTVFAAPSAAPSGTTPAKLARATFAGGCFWCMQPPFDKIKGVTSTVAGYTGGDKKDPTYEEVSAGGTGHAEAVEILYDPAQVSYAELLDVFWSNVDPTNPNGQFCDNGNQYRTAIFYHDEEQKRLAELSRERLAKSGRLGGKAIVTEIVAARTFYRAEEYHQEYYVKNPIRYKFYRFNCGRDQRLKQLWGETMVNTRSAESASSFVKPTKEELKKRLTPLQYSVTQENGTEKAFENEYVNNHRAGIYVDIVSGEALFSSRDKYDSGTGWPSFTRPLEPGNIVEREDRSLFSVRTEIRSKLGDDHIGHVFNDGPPPTGLRYCMNSAALRFIPREELEKAGYGRYLKLFDK